MSRKKLLSLMLSCTLAATTVFSNFGWSANSNVRAAETETVVEETQVDSNDYGLCDDIQDGVILHCFDWKYNDIKAELPAIAEAGFTSVQTSPAQKGDGDVWYWLYQPQTFSIQSNALGSKSELQALCDEAEKYGIKVIVDVVANHTRSIGDDGLGGDCYHYDEGSIDYGQNSNRYDYTHKRIGMPDLNSESATVQNKVKGYIQELKSVGVDGIRWDAAKHIGLPSENCNFWPAVTGEGLYNYGEILNGPLNGYGNNNELMKEYTNYISVTDDEYGDGVLNAINGGGVPSSIGNYSERGVSKDKLVYWAESHDTYSNNGEYGKATQYIDQNKIDRAYAIVAAQGKATSLYFSRPYETNKQSIMAGAKGSTHFTSKEVAAVNHLHNACVGQKDYYVQNGNAAAVCRETGAVIVKGSGSGQVSITNGGGTTAPGTYVDEVSGSTWTVTESTISGTVGDSGIAVIYDGNGITKNPKVTASKSSGSFQDAFDLTLTPSNATKATYSINGGDEVEFTTATKVKIGEGCQIGDKVTVKVTAVGEEGTTAFNETFTYTMSEAPEYAMYIRVKKSDFSTAPYLYLFNTGKPDLNGKWPGAAMTEDGEYYVYTSDTLDSASAILSTGDWRNTQEGETEAVVSGYMEYNKSSNSFSTFTISKPTKTAEPTQEPTKKPEATATVKPTDTPKATATVKPEATATVKPTGTPKATATVKPTGTPKATATVKPTSTPKATVAPTATASSQNMAPDNVPNDTSSSSAKVYYNINYELNNGYFVAAAPGSYTGEEDVTLLIPVREGYTFGGWYKDSTYKEQISVIKAGTTGDITVYAKWKKVSKPGKPVIATVKKANSTKKIKITLKKKVAGAVGYEVVIAKNAKFTKGKRVLRFTGLSKVISNLKAGKYYVKVRAYKLDSAGQRIYGAYCVKTKTIVLKK